jgi:hypothetical protein
MCGEGEGEVDPKVFLDFAIYTQGLLRPDPNDHVPKFLDSPC